MKRVVSVSLGSAKRDHAVETEILGEKFSIERIGTDGDVTKAMAMIRRLDGQVAAIGLGGTDLYIYAGGKRYTFRESLRLKNCARQTPVVDGSSLKNTLERRVVQYMRQELDFDFQGKKVLMVSAVDRFGMAEALSAAGAEMVFGDLMFGLGLPLPLRSLQSLARVAGVLAPIIVNLPIRLIYPTGSKQETSQPKFAAYYQAADIIAGDFLFIKKHLPERVEGKTIITNTVTAADIADLQRRGVKLLVTTTPELNGRSFGTNVMEGVAVAISGRGPEEMTAADFEAILDQIKFRPRVEYLQGTRQD